MKGLRILFLVAVLFIVAVPVFAAPPVQQGDSSTLEYASNGGATYCSDTWGCPACLSNMEGTMSVCAKIRYADGRCRCANPKPPTSTTAVCGTYTGSCKFLW